MIQTINKFCRYGIEAIFSTKNRTSDGSVCISITTGIDNFQQSFLKTSDMEIAP